jgi:hypothetical protein
MGTTRPMDPTIYAYPSPKTTMGEQGSNVFEAMAAHGPVFIQSREPTAMPLIMMDALL